MKQICEFLKEHTKEIIKFLKNEKDGINKQRTQIICYSGTLPLFQKNI